MKSIIANVLKRIEVASNPKIAALDKEIEQELSKGALKTDFGKVVELCEQIFKLGPKFPGWKLASDSAKCFLDSYDPKTDYANAVSILKQHGYVMTNKGKMIGANTTLGIFTNAAYPNHEYKLERTNYKSLGEQRARMRIELHSK